ncbi:MAG TPA: DUF1622 domain-containing protein [Flavisolibacter sp.]
MEDFAKSVAIYLSLGVEMLGAFVIFIGLLQFLRSYLPTLLRKDQYVDNTLLRVRFGSSLTIALELLLAADILQTAVAPTWEEIGKLAAIAAIRTALNYFLERELKEIESRKQNKNTP